MATVPTRSGSPRQLTTKQTGDAWEVQARRWLEGKGLRFIAANVNSFVSGFLINNGRPSTIPVTGSPDT